MMTTTTTAKDDDDDDYDERRRQFASMRSFCFDVVVSVVTTSLTWDVSNR